MAKKTQPKKTEEPKQDKAPEKPVYSHESKIRCPAKLKCYPAFLDKRCAAVMKCDQTLNGGKTKRWKCPKCGKFHRTEGKLI